MNASARRRVAVIFHRFGPYHRARLAAAARVFDVLGVEEAPETSEYDWDEVGTGDAFRRITLLGRGDRPVQPAREIARRTTAVLEREQPVAVVIPGWSDPAALAALRWGLENGVPAVVMSESTSFDEPRRGWKEWIKTRVVRRCAAGLVGGEPHAEYLAALGMPRERIFSGYDAVDNTHFAFGAAAARADGEIARARLLLPERYFLASSRFVPQKNLSGLLTAYTAYRRTVGSGAWKLVLLGDGPLRPALTEQIAALDLATDVLLPGFKQYGELPAYYGLASAFVHASTTEPWGLVVNEAMAAGLPVLVSERCGCVRELVVEGENGWTFPPADPAALTVFFTRTAACDASALAAMGAASQRRIADWSPEAFAANLERAVLTACAQPPHKFGPWDRLLFALLLRRAEGTARRLLPAPKSLP
jgi:1,2-diacylglycerol 3-alpha-glucosyltransferase